MKIRNLYTDSPRYFIDLHTSSAGVGIYNDLHTRGPVTNMEYSQPGSIIASIIKY